MVDKGSMGDGIPDFARIAARADVDEAELKKWSILLANVVGSHVRPLVVAAYGLGCLMDAGRLQRMGGKAKEGEQVSQIGVAALQQALRMVGLETGDSTQKGGEAGGGAQPRPDQTDAPSPVPESGGAAGQGDSPPPEDSTGDGEVNLPQGAAEVAGDDPANG